jgi:hypothetical protein
MAFWTEKRVYTIALFFLNIVDLITTLFMCRDGAREGNPIFDYLLSSDIKAFVFVKFVLSLICFFFLFVSDKKSRILRLLVPYFAGLITWQTLATILLFREM